MNPLTEELIAICRLFGGFERDTVCCGTVTIPQCVVLQMLLGGPSDVSGLASRVGGSNSAMTRLLDGLERNEWVERQRTPGDRRRVIVRLTPSGAAEATRLRNLTDDAVIAVMEHIPEDQREQCLSSLRLLRQAMQSARPLACCP